MGAVERFLKRTGSGRPDAAYAPFIEKALNKIIIHKMERGEPSEEGLEAVLIFKDKDGPDASILYTYDADGLKVGDSIVKKGKVDSYFLLVEEVKRVDGSEIIKVYNCLEVNVMIQTYKKEQPGYVLSNLKNQIKTSDKNSITVENKAAILVAPKDYNYRINETIDLVNIVSKEESASSWLVEGKDDITSPFIAYHYLTQVLKQKEFEESEEKPSYPMNSILKLNTKDGYFSSVPTVRIISREDETVTIRLPNSNTKLSYKIKDELGQIINNEIIVGE